MRVNPNSLLAVLVGFTLNLGLSGVAQAVLLPNATVDIFHDDQENGLHTGGYAFQVAMDTPWSWSTPTHGAAVLATSAPLPALTASVSSGIITNPAYQAYTSGIVRTTLRYYFSIDGPGISSLVPVRISGIYNMDVNGPAGRVLVSATVRDPGVRDFYNFFSDSYTASEYNGVFAGLMNLTPNKATAIDLWAELIVGSRISGGLMSSSNAAAYIDPYIEIDPTWALANPGYSISVSQGVGNTAPVPEAETYAMMLAGLGLVGFMARRRKQLEA